MHATGIVRSTDEASLIKYVKRLTGVEDLRWLSSAQAARVIETLKSWQGGRQTGNDGGCEMQPRALADLSAGNATASSARTSGSIWRTHPHEATVMAVEGR